MSFWTKIGLVDRQTVLDLQEQIRNIQNENKLLIEQNKKLLENLNDQISYKSEELKGDIQLTKSALQDENDKQGAKIQELMGDVQKIGDNVSQAYDSLSTDIKSAVQDSMHHAEHIAEDQNKYHEVIVEHIKRESETLGGNILVQLINMKKDIKKDVQNIVNENISKTENTCQKVQEILDKTDGIAEKCSEIERMNTKLSDMNETVSNLCTVTKAVWVDSIIGDIEKSL